MEFFNNLARIFVYDPDAPLLFNSGQFLLLFLVFMTVYNLIYKRKQLVSIYITLFSLFFYYKSSGNYVVILVATTILDYIIGNRLAATEDTRKRKWWVVAGVVPSMLLLAYFKYTNFIIFNIDQLIGSNFGFMEIFLPVGISFYTFQSVSYIIDIYWRRVPPAKSLIDFAFYLTFFPQLVAGPIVKANLFLPQLDNTPTLSREKAYSGLWLIITGLFKKAVIANYIAQYNDLIFAAPQTYSGFENLMAVLGYALQIFCDFAGYSDMAIGIGRIMGYDLGINFKSPYKSLTVSEFWKRWHISLSSWLMEYLYIPLGGNREVSKFSVISVPVLVVLAAALTCGINAWVIALIVVGILGLIAYQTGNKIMIAATLVGATVIAVALFMKGFLIAPIIISICIIAWVVTIAFPQTVKMIRTDVNLLLTMLIGGLWHGAAWKFVLWGGAHGVALGIDKIRKQLMPDNRFTRFLTWLCTFVVVIVLWMFFRANDITVETEGGTENLDAFQVPLIMLRQIFTNFDITFAVHFWDARMLWVILVAFGYLCHAVPENWAARIEDLFVKSNIAIKILILVVVMQLVVQLQGEEVQPFIYFQF